MTIPKRIFGIDQDQIQIPLQFPVLEPVIQDEKIGTELSVCIYSCPVTIPGNNHGTSGNRPCEKRRLVSCHAGICIFSLPIRYLQDLLPISTAVPSRQNGHPMPLIERPFGQHNHCRRFSGPAHGQIANAHHKAGKGSAPEDLLLICPQP